MSEVDLWKFAAGIGLFLFGMHELESSLKVLTGRAFKKFIREFTKSPIRGVIAGTLTTAVLQSSSVVTLMLLAFAGAGIIELRNALGIVFGSNLGTTFTGWVVTTLGFKVDFDKLIMPLLALGTIGMIYFNAEKKQHNIARFLAGIAFLFMGLGFMKTSVEVFAKTADLTMLIGYGPIIFLVFGFGFTALIQSSSASMMIALSAVHAGVIPLIPAVAFVIGADLGTTITAVLGATKGTPVKQRVALAHFMFNLITDLVAFAFMIPLLNLIKSGIGIDDPLYTIVVFHSLMNFIGIALFLPATTPFAKFLETKFKQQKDRISVFINRVPEGVPEASLTALSNEVREYFYKVVQLNLESVGLAHDKTLQVRAHVLPEDASWPEKYETLKRHEGEILEFAVGIQKRSLEADESKILGQLLNATHYGAVSAKDMKDIRHNLKFFTQEDAAAITDFMTNLVQRLNSLYANIRSLWDRSHKTVLAEEIGIALSRNRENYQVMLKEIYHLTSSGQISEVNLSSLMNMNSELFKSSQALILGMRDLLLERNAAEAITEMPLNQH